MADSGFDVVVVRKSGPVHTMKFRKWWLYFLFLVLILMLACLGAGSYLLYRQHQAFNDIGNDTRLLMLRTERLEALMQEQENLALLAHQAAQEKAAAQMALKTAKAEPLAGKPQQTAKAEPIPKNSPVAKPEPELAENPRFSDLVGIRNIKYTKQGSEIRITFDTTNLGDPSNPAVGYVTVVLRGSRRGKPWIEAWPSIRLTPLGRPLRYQAGTPFSVQRYRRLKAKFAEGDKQLDKLEFLVYSREGKLLLVKEYPLTQETEPKKPGSDDNAGLPSLERLG